MQYHPSLNDLVLEVWHFEIQSHQPLQHFQILVMEMQLMKLMEIIAVHQMVIMENIAANMIQSRMMVNRKHT